MKKYSIITLLAALMMPFGACNDDFMQRDPIDQMADGTFFVKEADLKLYLFTDTMYMDTVFPEPTIRRTTRVSLL